MLPRSWPTACAASPLDFISQSNRILLNITSDYNPGLLAADIKSYFEANRNAVAVLLFKGKKSVQNSPSLQVQTEQGKVACAHST